MTTFNLHVLFLSLCEDDNQWIDCLQESVMITHVRMIRRLFCNIALFCMPANPGSIYSQIKDEMSSDFLRRRGSVLNLSQDEVRQVSYNDFLLSLNDEFERHGKSNATFKIPMPEQLHDVHHIEDPSDYETDAVVYFDANHPLLNEEQLQSFNIVANDITTGVGSLHTFDAFGGSGKTFLSNILLSYVCKLNKIARATAYSGIAATLLRLGKTFHREFKVPIPCFNDSCSSMKLNSEEAEFIRMACLIMIDEISMMHWNQLDLLDRLLRELIKKDEFMGGKCVVLMGDLRQCPPVVICNSSRAAIVSA